MPFIGLKIPFIGRIQPHVRPLVGKKLPSIKNPGFSGFTLIELITTLVVAGILMSLAAPSFNNFVKNNRLTTQANDMMADLAFARSEAVKRATNVIVCKSTDGLTCNAGANWQDGWIVGVDANTTTTLDAGEPILRAHEALTGQNTLVGTANDGTAPLTNQLVYTRTGMSTMLAAEEFRLCDSTDGPTMGRWIQVAVTGRARIAISPNTSQPLPPPSCSPL